MWGKRKQSAEEVSITDGARYFLFNASENTTVIKSKFYADLCELIRQDGYNHIRGLKSCPPDELGRLQGKAEYADRLLEMLEKYTEICKNEGR